MTDPKQILSTKDYKNYRNVRAIGALFIVFGSGLMLSGITLIGDSGVTRGGAVYLFVLACFGAAGVIGGIGTLRGSRRWAPMVRLMAVLCLLCFPILTLLSYVILSRLSRYLDSMEQINAVAAGKQTGGTAGG